MSRRRMRESARRGDAARPPKRATNWLGPLTTGLSSLGRPQLATLVLAVFRGLLMNLDATGDASPTTAAFLDDLQLSMKGART